MKLAALPILGLILCSMSNCEGRTRLPKDYDPYALEQQGVTVFSRSDESIEYLTAIWAGKDEGSDEVWISFDISSYSLQSESGSNSRYSMYVVPDGEGYKATFRQESFTFWSVENGKYYDGHASLSGDLYEDDATAYFIWNYYQKNKDDIHHIE